MKSFLMGSAASVLLALSAISDAKPFVQLQEPKAVQQAQPPSQQQNPLLVPSQTGGDSSKVSRPAANGKSSQPTEDVAIAAQTYTATAYSLRGRTASGKPVSRGLIAADPSVLPLGTRVRVEAGSLSGEYLVADTGGAIKGRRIDIWTPTARQALQFGRRPVKLTVLALGAKPESRTRARKNH